MKKILLALLLIPSIGFAQAPIQLDTVGNACHINTVGFAKDNMTYTLNGDSSINLVIVGAASYQNAHYSRFRGPGGAPFPNRTALTNWMDANFFANALADGTSGGGGTVKSVSATISPGSAISISGSPVTDSGTLAFTFTGSANQLIAGDGSLVLAPSASEWGTITGTLSNQTDLQGALNAKLTTPTPLIAGIVLGTTLSTNTIGMVGYSQAPLGDQLAMYDFGGQVKVSDPVDSNDATSKKFVENFAIPITEKAANNGVATLGADGKVPPSQLNISGGFVYKGSWNAATNTPPLGDTVGTNGDMYKVSVSGTRDLGSGSIVFNEGDHVVYVGAPDNKYENFGASEAVASVAGLTGAITAAALKTALAIQNVDNTSDLNKPVSTATQSTLNLKINKAGDAMSGELKVVFPAASKKTILAMSDPGAAHTADGTLGATSTYLQIGGGEWGAGSYRLIGFGYLTPETNHSPAFVGYQETSTTSNTRGDLIFGTRPNNNNVAPNVIMRINSGGQILAEDTTYLPTAKNSLVTKKYVDSVAASGGAGGGVPQTSSPSRTYVTTSNGQQSYISYTNTYAEGSAMVQYTPAGNIFVSDPTDPAHASPKSYIDNAVQNAVAGGYFVARQDSPFIKGDGDTSFSVSDIAIPLPQREAHFWAKYEIMVSSVMDSVSHIKLSLPSPGAGLTIKGTASMQGVAAAQTLTAGSVVEFPTDGYPKTIEITLYVDCFPEGVTWGSLELSMGCPNLSDPPIQVYEGSRVIYRETNN